MSDATNQATEKLAEMFSGWKTEHERLDATMLELFQWINAPLHRRWPPCTVAAERLRELLTQLRVHFVHEETLGEMLAASHGGATHEIQAVRERVAREHRILGDRLQGIIDELVRGADAAEDIIAVSRLASGSGGGGLSELAKSEPGNEASSWWDSILVQLNLFYDLLEQHEEQEERAVQWLRPTA